MSDNYQAVYDATKQMLRGVISELPGYVRGAIENAFGGAYQAMNCLTQAAIDIGNAHTRPSVLYRAALGRGFVPDDPTPGNVYPGPGAELWIAHFSGCEGTGKSPEEAMAAFDKAWSEKLPERSP